MGNWFSRLREPNPGKIPGVRDPKIRPYQAPRPTTTPNVDIPSESSAGNTPRTSTESIFSPVGDEILLNDTDLADFDDGMKQCAQKVLGSIEQGLKPGGLELSSLKEVTRGLVEMDEDVVKFILESELDLWANDEMKELVTQYFENSLRALDFYEVLEKSVEHARDNQMIIETAIRYMPEDREPNEEECRRILRELDIFVRAENPFSSEFGKLFSDIYKQQKQFQVKLTERNKRMHKRERNVRAVKKVTNAMLTATCVSLVIFAAVAMAVAAPMTNRSVSEAASLPFDSMQGWLRSLWSNYERKVKVETAVLDTANYGTWVTIQDLDTLNSEVKRLNGDIEGIIRNIQFGQVRGDSLAVQQAVKAIRRKQEQFVTELEDLNSHIIVCSRRINKTRDIVLKKILNNNS